MSVGRISYQLAYQISPIILVDGIASLMGGLMPIVLLTQMVNTAQGSLNIATGDATAADLLKLDNFYAHFKPMAGGTLHNNQIGQYPFANQKVAANAIIAQPLSIPMLMTCHPRIKGAAVNRLLSGVMIKEALDKHNFSGGTYHILTPQFMYRNCIMLDMKDITPGNSEHPQVEWQMNFTQPLITQSEATGALNKLATQLNSFMPTTP